MTKPVRKGWFEIPGIQEGERTLAEAVVGLELIRHNLQGQHVLDLGCAEGLVGLWCLERGAASVYGLDGNPALIKTGQRLAKSLDEPRQTLHFWNLNGDLNPPTPIQQYGIVLALSIIHKLKDPERFLKRLDRLASGWLVIRAPASNLMVESARHRLDIPNRLLTMGFKLMGETPEAKVPWVGTFQRVKA